MCKDQLCVSMKHAKFLSPFLSINYQCTKKHKARVFIIRYYKLLGGGGKLEGLGGEASPPHPPVDETLVGLMYQSLHHCTSFITKHN